MMPDNIATDLCTIPPSCPAAHVSVARTETCTCRRLSGL